MCILVHNGGDQVRHAPGRVHNAILAFKSRR